MIETASGRNDLADRIQIPPLPNSHTRSGAWGFWATSGIGLGVILLWLLAQIVVGVGYFFVRLFGAASHPDGIDGLVGGLEYDGLMIAVSSLTALPLLILGCCFFAGLRRKHGITIRDYLALQPMSVRTWVFWTVAAVPFVFVVDAILKLCGAPEVDPWMQDMADHVTHFWLLALVIVVCAPVGEELFFRGFLFRGWMDSRLGKAWTVVLTSLLFASIHFQYGPWGLILVFFLGLLLGTARVLTGSLWAPMAVHFVTNVAATWELYELMKAA